MFRIFILIFLSVWFFFPQPAFSKPLNCGRTGCSYFRLGLGRYVLDQPEFHVATKGVASEPLGKISNNRFVSSYSLSVGHRFSHQDSSIFSRLFGKAYRIEFMFDYFNTHHTKNNHDSNWGRLWLIDNTIMGVFGRVTPYEIYDFTIKAKQRFSSGGLYFKGERKTAQAAIMFEPYIGLIHIDLHEHNSFTAEYNSGSVMRKDSEEYAVQTEYNGVALGNRFNFHTTSRFISFAELEVQLLHAHTKLTAHQDGLVGAPVWWNAFRKTVEETNRKRVTHRGMITLGGTYQLLNHSESPSVTMKAGIDYFGYKAKVNTPNSRGNRPVHIKGDISRNAFFCLEARFLLG